MEEVVSDACFFLAQVEHILHPRSETSIEVRVNSLLFLYHYAVSSCFGFPLLEQAKGLMS